MHFNKLVITRRVQFLFKCIYSFFLSSLYCLCFLKFVEYSSFRKTESTFFKPGYLCFCTHRKINLNAWDFHQHLMYISSLFNGVCLNLCVRLFELSGVKRGGVFSLWWKEVQIKFFFKYLFDWVAFFNFDWWFKKIWGWVFVTLSWTGVTSRIKLPFSFSPWWLEYTPLTSEIYIYLTKVKSSSIYWLKKIGNYIIINLLLRLIFLHSYILVMTR